jgi:DNA-binding PadR family transcriptional regulator
MTEAALQILIALADGEKHGYAIMREVAERTGGRVKLYPGTLYANIKRLLADGLIDELDERPDADDERRRYYRLSRAGRSAAKAEIERLDAIVSAARASGLVLKARR